MSLKPINNQPTTHQKPEEHGAEGSGIIDMTKTLRKIDSAPSTANNPNSKTHKQVPVDLIEEESMESFPASGTPRDTITPIREPLHDFSLG